MAESMKSREFLELLPDLVRQQLPPGLEGFQVIGPTGSLVKLHYHRPTVHYEVQDAIAILTLDAPPANCYSLPLMRSLDDAILRCALAFRTGPDGPGPEDEMAFGSFQTL